MGLNNVSFKLGQGGLGRPLPGEDFISGLLFYSANLPSGFTTSNRILKFFSLQDAVTAGLAGNSSDATSATGTYLITALGAVGNTIQIDVAGFGGAITNLCIYKEQAGDTTIALLGASIMAAINAGTQTHGFVATFATATLTITAPKSYGKFLNTGSPIIVTIVGTIAGTITQFSGGAGSIFDVFYYHISEYFRLIPQGVLYVGIFPIPGTYAFTEITTMQNFAIGSMRQIGVFKDSSSAFASGDISLINGVCSSLVTAHKEIIALYAADISATSDVSTLTDLSALSANLVSAVIGQDGGAVGNQLFAATGKSVTTLGALLGAIASALVSQSIAWVANFNISNGVECDVIAFANGVPFSNASVTDSLLSVMQNMRYIFLRKFVGIAGSYFNENSSAIALNSDYAYIADNRTMQKATRGIYINVVPALNSPITLNSDGTLANESIAYFTGLAEAPLIQMVRNGELSGYGVSVNATQNVLSTGILIINVNLLEIATGRNIQVNIGYQVTV